jgi:PAS domain S-box-containing protein
MSMQSQLRPSQDVEFWRRIDTLRTRESRLSLILQGVQDHAISLLDASGCILMWNAAAERIKGYPLEEVRGQHVRLLFTEEDRRHGLPEAELLQAELTGKFQGDGWRQRKDGARFYASVSLSALRDETGEMCGFVKVTHDITERVRAQRAVELLGEASAVLAASLEDPRMLSQFARTVGNSLAELVFIDLFNEQGQVEPEQTLHLGDPGREATLKAVRKERVLTVRQHPVYSIANGQVRSFTGDGRHLVEPLAANEMDRAALTAACTRYAMIFPLVVRGAVQGALCLGRDSYGFDERDVTLGEELARRLSLAIDNVRLLARAQAGERRLHLALEAGQMGAWEWDVERQVVTWSPTLEDIHGIARGSFGGTFEAYCADMHPEDQPAVLAALQATLTEGIPYHVTYRIVRPDQQVRWLDARAQLLKDASNTSRRLVGVCMDITDRRSAQARIEASEQRFRAVFDHALDGMLITATGGRVVDANPAACALLDLPREGLLGRHLPKPDASGCTGAAQTTEDLSQRGEMRLQRAGGGVIDVEYSLAANVFPGHDFAVWRDTSARKRAEESLAFLAQASAVLTSSLDYPVAISNAVRLAVPHLADWAALDVLEPDGTLQRLAIAHADPARVALAQEISRRWPASTEDAQGVAQVIRSGQAELQAEIRDEILEQSIADAELLAIVRQLGLRSSMCVPLSVRGRTIGAITLLAAESGRRFTAADLRLAEDLARRVAAAIDNARLYESEQQARRNADAANRAKDDFLATISHELRTPLNAMLGWTRIVRSGALDRNKYERALETIERNAVTQAQLIEDLLDVSRIISGKLRLDFEPIQLARLVDQAVDTLRPTSEAKQLRVQCAIEQTPIPLWGDPNRLQQVVWNLISNAIKFTPEQGNIRLELRHNKDTVSLTVSDSGAGIKPELLPYVFDRFRQADGATTRAFGGLGLGLAISRHIVELHGGRITASSQGEGTGATFCVVLPLANADRSEKQLAPSSVRQLDASIRESYSELVGLKVLVVDDDQDARELVTAILSGCGSEVYAAADAKEAFVLFQRERPDVLLSDIGLPGEDGYSLIRKIRALPHHEGGDTPSAALTAYARIEDRRKALDAGYMMHLPKPLEPAELVLVVASLIRSVTR